jgi:hypothetical protein
MGLTGLGERLGEALGPATVGRPLLRRVSDEPWKRAADRRHARGRYASSTFTADTTVNVDLGRSELHPI